MFIIGLCVAISALFETRSYYRQIRKTTRRKKSDDVSLKAYGDKLIKYTFGTAALILSHNYVGLSLELVAFTMCIYTYIVIKKNKRRR